MGKAKKEFVLNRRTSTSKNVDIKPKTFSQSLRAVCSGGNKT